MLVGLTALLATAGCGGSGASTTAAPAAPGTAAAGQESGVVKIGDNISVHYTGTLDDGTQFDSSRGGDPLTFAVGSGQLIPGFDRAVIGLRVGQSVKVHIAAKDAYGERRPDLVRVVPIAQAPPGLTVGARVALGNSPAVVTAVTAGTVTVDANSELAGQALNFEIELVRINHS
ncbi:MAG: peptidylprolyl isomerase [Dehalococcoidia bacterium]|nr:peptidylprolyl isomerase [Dehalococcoidia bacterium]